MDPNHAGGGAGLGFAPGDDVHIFRARMWLRSTPDFCRVPEGKYWSEEQWMSLGYHGAAIPRDSCTCGFDHNDQPPGITTRLPSFPTLPEFTKPTRIGSLGKNPRIGRQRDNRDKCLEGKKTHQEGGGDAVVFR